MEGMTPVERFIDEQVSPHLGGGELITHRGYFRVSRGVKRDASLIRAGAGMMGAMVTGGSSSKRMKHNRGFFIALTAQRLFLIETRPKTLGPALKNNWMGWWGPADIRISFAPDGLHLDTRDGKSFVLEIDRSTKHSSTQADLLATLGAP